MKILGFSTLIATFALARSAFAEIFLLPSAANLRTELGVAVAKKEPLIVMVSLEGCPFCKIARENYLKSIQLEQKLKIVQVDMQKRTPVIDFSGRTTSHEQLIKTWGVQLAPTLLFFGKEGKELVERLSGGSSSDFYGAYLDQRITRALQLSKA